MAGGTVDGLVSGLDTTAIITQLMQVESAPQTALKNKVTNQQKIISAYQSINTRMLAVKNAGNALGLDATWQAVQASSSSTAVSVAATSSSATGSFLFDVKALAKAQIRTATVASSGAITTGTGLDITIGATTTHIAVTTDTAQGVADAINASTAAGVKAAVLTTDQGTMLQLTATKTGTSNAFTITGLQAATTVAVAAADAQMQVGTVGAGGYTVTQASNTFTGLINGVTLTANKVENGVTVTIAADAEAIADKMQALVDAANAALNDLSNNVNYDATAKKAGLLMSDHVARELHAKLRSVVSRGQVPGYGDFKQLGVQADSKGKITLDRAAFIAAYQANPTTVKAAVATNGLAKGFEDLGKAATDATTGSLTLAIQDGTSYVANLNTKVTEWDTRLSLKKVALQKQFTNLETALGKMKSQSSWLSAQIDKLPSSSGK